MLNPTNIVLILIPLKPLKAKQNAMINYIPMEKAIILIGENK